MSDDPQRSDPRNVVTSIAEKPAVQEAFEEMLRFGRRYSQIKGRPNAADEKRAKLELVVGVILDAAGMFTAKPVESSGKDKKSGNDTESDDEQIAEGGPVETQPISSNEVVAASAEPDSGKKRVRFNEEPEVEPEACKKRVRISEEPEVFFIPSQSHHDSSPPDEAEAAKQPEELPASAQAAASVPEHEVIVLDD